MSPDFQCYIPTYQGNTYGDIISKQTIETTKNGKAITEAKVRKMTASLQLGILLNICMHVIVRAFSFILMEYFLYFFFFLETQSYMKAKGMK